MKAIRSSSSLSNIILKNSTKSSSTTSLKSATLCCNIVVNQYTRLLSGVRSFSSQRSRLFDQSNNTSLTTTTGTTTSTTGSTIYERLGKESFGEDVASILMAPLPDQDIEVKPDGILYLPEIKYRRILNKAFGPGGWCLVPISDFKVEKGSIIQEYSLFCRGQFVSQAFGEQTVDEQGYKSIGSSLEGAKSNALMRCCKDIGIASELWDPNFIIAWKAENVVEAFCEHVTKKTTKKLYRRKDREFSYPYVEKKSSTTTGAATTARKQQSSSAAAATTESSVVAEEEVNDEPSSMMTPDSVSTAADSLDSEASLFDSFGMDDGPAQYKKEQATARTARKYPATAASSSGTTTSNSRGNYQFDIEGTFPFGKFKGQKVRDIISTSDFKRYLKYMEENNIQPQLLAQVKSYMAENNL